jgi:NADH-quinone oxidoreductase subunit G
MARESVGYHDALGSNLFLHVRRGEVLRTVPRDNDAVNECWLSDRDRYSHQGLYAADRAVRPMVKEGGAWVETSWEQALARAAQILRDNAADELGMLVHPATSNEEGALIARLAEALGTGNLDHRIAQLDLSDGAVAEPFAMPVSELDSAQAIVIVGTNIRHELPLVHARIRKAWTRGAKIHVVNPVDFDFTFELAGRRIVAPSQIADALGDSALRDALTGASSAAIIVGSIAENGPHAARIRAAARSLAEATGARLCRIPQGANALGLSRHGVLPTSLDARSMLEQPRAAYVLYGIEPALDFASTPQALAALNGAQVVAFSHFACESTRAIADVILPIGLLPEIDATLTNLDGRDQSTVAGGKLPDQARPGWRVLRALAGELGVAGFDFVDYAGARASIAPRTVRVAAGVAPAPESSGLEIASAAGIYRSDAVVRRAPALQAHPLNRESRAYLNPQDAQALGLETGAIGRFAVAAGTAKLPVEVSAKVAPGTVYLEGGHGATAPLGHSRVESGRA